MEEIQSVASATQTPNLDLFSSAIPDCRSQGQGSGYGCSKDDGSAWLLSAVANVNWPFAQNRTGYRLHFNFPHPHPLPLAQLERLANSLASISFSYLH